MKSLISVLFIMVLLSGCTSSDEGILCETGPVGLTFEVIDEATGENLFEDEFNPNQLQIENNEEERVDVRFETERNVFNVLLGWESKSDTYTVTIAEEIEFTFAFTLEESSSGGCTSTKLTALEITGATYEIQETSDVTTIFVSSTAE
ncbi:hypothetical protein [Salinimicrobium sediminilitoris]|uniref:hypothetical protein n=1 Tax=Salinimicrobium sediminilitoris TaxID=2876715 RepID=UPI001E3D3E54|nr:hypothetical protein [Salinimicrobium sediminilitoris]MCC8359966.1 hypothetical protein [Salinimicrobium sediminilitoris]